ncbi:ABC transporter substrate-binding protein [Solirubrobacter phytolaccae]|uniref:ABC transporter substrate-binding protein n=1 Tax=Solirubrobacter phytolaccae TaxID=1404360 RepID=A0A9X3NF92_9ACTN|nr:ABC transporter substrate-binding protein [Solirubrobacter phytolaccae]MDA0185605.1 ABC transporter substrate-binding protein [Solirubrobacter phytolaccae]
MNLKLLLTPLLATTVLVAACGGTDTPDAPTVSTKPVSEIAVPPDLEAKGTLTIGTDASYPPIEFMAADGKTVEGLDADLGKALAATLGLKAEVQHATFDSILPGLTTKKFDVGMSGFTDTKEREKTVDFVTYFSAGTSFFVKAQEGGTVVNTLDDLCGRTLALQKGTAQVEDAAAQQKQCAAAGKPAIKVMTFPDQPGANLAVVSGRADVGMTDSPVAAYQAKQSNGQLAVVGEPYGSAPYGIALPKGSPLATAIRAALKALIVDGTYGEILAKYGIEAGAITEPGINQAAE